MVACVRRVEAGKGEELERSLPVGESRRSVGSWGVVFCARKAVRRLVRSIVCDIGLTSGGCDCEEGRGGSKMLGDAISFVLIFRDRYRN
tara:strand:- start:954 stop:1220 length:267 start_codon:yes stop_codon:yes gene_type:complete